jgi:hypothetical protein
MENRRKNEAGKEADRWFAIQEQARKQQQAQEQAQIDAVDAEIEELYKLRRERNEKYGDDGDHDYHKYGNMYGGKSTRKRTSNFRKTRTNKNYK